MQRSKHEVIKGGDQNRACWYACLSKCALENADWKTCGFLLELTKPQKHAMIESVELAQLLLRAQIPTHLHTNTCPITCSQGPL